MYFKPKKSQINLIENEDKYKIKIDENFLDKSLSHVSTLTTQ